MLDPRAIDDLAEHLPPEGEELSGPETLDDVQDQPEPQEPRQTVQQVAPAASREELDEIAGNIISVVAEMGSQSLPLPLQQTYYNAVTSNKLIRRGLVLSGLPGALDELAPSGVGDGGPIKQLHPLLRLAAGLLVLAAGSFLTRRAVLENAQAANQ